MDKKYEEDWKNFCDHGDIGDDWLVLIFKLEKFSKRDVCFLYAWLIRCSEEVVQAILTWIKTNIEFDDPILDIGCGNAAFIFQMVCENFIGCLVQQITDLKI